MSAATCLAAKFLSVDIFLFEPNMVIGKSNRLFLKFSKKIFCYSPDLKNFPKKYLNKINVIPPLLRREIYDFKNLKKESKKNFQILIIGGSQGAQIFEKNLIPLILDLSKKLNIYIYHQVKTNEKNYNELSKIYIDNKIQFKLFNFEEDIYKYIFNSDIVITRSGASTLAELIFLNTPFITIPFQHSKDNHQLENALYYEKKGCCWLFEEKNFFTGNSNNFLFNLLKNTEDIIEKKENMKKISYQNTWNNINEILTVNINEN
tara:strand:- start:1327 stop:2112 length:786 start_codon:yes stop_codon:yes gene_type:complete